jgi:hypothetical protein
MHGELDFCASVAGGGSTCLKMFYVPGGKVKMQNGGEWIEKFSLLEFSIDMSSTAVVISVVDGGPCHCLLSPSISVPKTTKYCTLAH